MVVGIGEILWDMLPEGRQLGGAPANFAYGVGQLGIDSMVISAVGQDALGQEILQLLDAKGLKAYCPAIGAPTGVVDVRVDAKGIPDYDIKEGVAWDELPFTETLAEIASRTRVVCFGSLAQRCRTTRQTIARFIATMPQEDNCYRVFDINLRKHYYSLPLIEDSLRMCNVLKINDEELELISKEMNLLSLEVSERCRLLLERYSLRMLILTCGTRGSYIYTPQEVSFVETPRVAVVDTVGAGDSFTAAFMASILQGISLRDAHLRAVDVSAYVCTQAGAMPVYPTKL